MQMEVMSSLHIGLRMHRWQFRRLPSMLAPLSNCIFVPEATERADPRTTDRSRNADMAGCLSVWTAEGCLDEHAESQVDVSQAADRFEEVEPLPA
jgi:hypothetical protein